MSESFPTPSTDRFFEDYKVGATYLCGSFTLTEESIIDFAGKYDPQMMHVDRALAAKGPYGEVIASGWHTIAEGMRLFVDNFLPFNGLASPGIDELRWPLPARPGDTLTLHVTVLEARRSRSRPDRGLIKAHMQMINQNNEVVVSLKPTNFIRVRHPEA